METESGCDTLSDAEATLIQSESRPMAPDSQPVTQASDAELMHLVQSQDQNALMALYQRYGNLVYSQALYVLRASSLAEEVTQDVFLKMWHQAERWDPSRGQLSSWLLTVSRHAAIDRLRKEQRRPGLDAASLESVAYTLQDRGTIDDPLWHDGQLLRRLIGQLPVEQQQVIDLAYYQGLTHSELSQHLDLPLGTVKTRLRLGLSKLRALWLEAHREEAGQEQRE
jgi:RNA polymerase sigma-70 factor, ECF subfamily